MAALSVLTNTVQRLDQTLSDPRKNYRDKVNAVASSWVELSHLLESSYCGGNIEVKVDVIVNKVCTLHRNTVFLVLNGDWSKESPASKTHLKTQVSNCADKLTNVDAVMAFQCRSLVELVENPWGNAALKKIIGAEPCEDSIAHEFLRVDQHNLKMRLQTLCESKCLDIAQRLAEVIWHLSRQSESFPLDFFIKSDLELMLDMYIVLLVKLNKHKEVITKMKELPLREGLDLVIRLKNYQSTPPDSARIWKNSRKTAELVIQVFATRAVLQSTEEVNSLLDDLMMEWVELLCVLQDRFNELIEMINKIDEQVSSAAPIFSMCRALVSKLGDRQRLKCIELYIKGLTLDVNYLEQLRAEGEGSEQAIRTVEVRLSAGFLELAKLFSDSIRMCRECVLTAFSLNPTQSCLDSVKEMAKVSERCEVEITDTGQGSDPDSGKSDVDRVELLQEAARLGLPQRLIDDLQVVFTCPRYRVLTWNLSQEELIRQFEKYFQEMEQGPRHIVKELKYLDIDYDKFKHLPKEDETHDGIEKGYEVVDVPSESHIEDDEDFFYQNDFSSSPTTDPGSDSSFKVKSKWSDPVDTRRKRTKIRKTSKRNYVSSDDSRGHVDNSPGKRLKCQRKPKGRPAKCDSKRNGKPTVFEVKVSNEGGLKSTHTIENLNSSQTNKLANQCTQYSEGMLPEDLRNIFNRRGPRDPQSLNTLRNFRKANPVIPRDPTHFGNMNLNPKIILQTDPSIELYKKRTASGCREPYKYSKSLSSVVPGLDSHDMMAPAPLESTVQVVHVTGGVPESSGQSNGKSTNSSSQGGSQNVQSSTQPVENVVTPKLVDSNHSNNRTVTEEASVSSQIVSSTSVPSTVMTQSSVVVQPVSLPHTLPAIQPSTSAPVLVSGPGVNVQRRDAQLPGVQQRHVASSQNWERGTSSNVPTIVTCRIRSSSTQTRPSVTAAALPQFQQAFGTAYSTNTGGSALKQALQGSRGRLTQASNIPGEPPSLLLQTISSDNVVRQEVRLGSRTKTASTASGFGTQPQEVGFRTQPAGFGVQTQPLQLPEQRQQVLHPEPSQQPPQPPPQPPQPQPQEQLAAGFGAQAQPAGFGPRTQPVGFTPTSNTPTQVQLNKPGRLSLVSAPSGILTTVPAPAVVMPAPALSLVPTTTPALAPTPSQAPTPMLCSVLTQTSSQTLSPSLTTITTMPSNSVGTTSSQVQTSMPLTPGLTTLPTRLSQPKMAAPLRVVTTLNSTTLLSVAPPPISVTQLSRAPSSTAAQLSIAPPPSTTALLSIAPPSSTTTLLSIAPPSSTTTQLSIAPPSSTTMQLSIAPPSSTTTQLSIAPPSSTTTQLSIAPPSSTTQLSMAPSSSTVTQLSIAPPASTATQPSVAPLSTASALITALPLNTTPPLSSTPHLSSTSMLNIPTPTSTITPISTTTSLSTIPPLSTTTTQSMPLLKTVNVSSAGSTVLPLPPLQITSFNSSDLKNEVETTSDEEPGPQRLQHSPLSAVAQAIVSKRVRNRSTVQTISKISKSTQPHDSFSNTVAVTQSLIVESNSRAQQVAAAAVAAAESVVTPNSVSRPLCLPTPGGTSREAQLQAELLEFESVLAQVSTTRQLKERQRTPSRSKVVVQSETQTPTSSQSASVQTHVNIPFASVTKVSSTYTQATAALSPATSITSQSSISPSTTPGSSLPSTPSKSKPKTKVKLSGGHVINPSITSSVISKTQKTTDDEQTTLRILSILRKYDEELRCSPEVHNKPAPRRRNQGTGSGTGGKRKKGKSKASSASDLSTDDMTLGSEDSSAASHFTETPQETHQLSPEEGEVPVSSSPSASVPNSFQGLTSSAMAAAGLTTITSASSPGHMPSPTTTPSPAATPQSSRASEAADSESPMPSDAKSGYQNVMYLVPVSSGSQLPVVVSSGAQVLHAHNMQVPVVVRQIPAKHLSADGKASGDVPVLVNVSGRSGSNQPLIFSTVQNIQQFLSTTTPNIVSSSQLRLPAASGSTQVITSTLSAPALSLTTAKTVTAATTSVTSVTTTAVADSVKSTAVLESPVFAQGNTSTSDNAEQGLSATSNYEASAVPPVPTTPVTNAESKVTGTVAAERSFAGVTVVPNTVPLSEPNRVPEPETNAITNTSTVSSGEYTLVSPANGSNIQTCIVTSSNSASSVISVAGSNSSVSTVPGTIVSPTLCPLSSPTTSPTRPNTLLGLQKLQQQQQQQQQQKLAAQLQQLRMKQQKEKEQEEQQKQLLRVQNVQQCLSQRQQQKQQQQTPQPTLVESENDVKSSSTTPRRTKPTTLKYLLQQAPQPLPPGPGSTQKTSPLQSGAQLVTQSTMSVNSSNVQEVPALSTQQQAEPTSLQEPLSQLSSIQHSASGQSNLQSSLSAEDNTNEVSIATQLSSQLVAKQSAQLSPVKLEVSSEPDIQHHNVEELGTLPVVSSEINSSQSMDSEQYSAHSSTDQQNLVVSSDLNQLDVKSHGNQQVQSSGPAVVQQSGQQQLLYQTGGPVTQRPVIIKSEDHGPKMMQSVVSQTVMSLPPLLETPLLRVPVPHSAVKESAGAQRAESANFTVVSKPAGNQGLNIQNLSTVCTPGTQGTAQQPPIQSPVVQSSFRASSSLGSVVQLSAEQGPFSQFKSDHTLGQTNTRDETTLPLDQQVMKLGPERPKPPITKQYVAKPSASRTLSENQVLPKKIAKSSPSRQQPKQPLPKLLTKSGFTKQPLQRQPASKQPVQEQVSPPKQDSPVQEVVKQMLNKQPTSKQALAKQVISKEQPKAESLKQGVPKQASAKQALPKETSSKITLPKPCLIKQGTPEQSVSKQAAVKHPSKQSIPKQAIPKPTSNKQETQNQVVIQKAESPKKSSPKKSSQRQVEGSAASTTKRSHKRRNERLRTESIDEPSTDRTELLQHMDEAIRRVACGIVEPKFEADYGQESFPVELAIAALCGGDTEADGLEGIVQGDLKSSGEITLLPADPADNNDFDWSEREQFSVIKGRLPTSTSAVAKSQSSFVNNAVDMVNTSALNSKSLSKTSTTVRDVSVVKTAPKRKTSCPPGSADESMSKMGEPAGTKKRAPAKSRSRSRSLSAALHKSFCPEPPDKKKKYPLLQSFLSKPASTDYKLDSNMENGVQISEDKKQYDEGKERHASLQQELSAHILNVKSVEGTMTSPPQLHMKESQPQESVQDSSLKILFVPKLDCEDPHSISEAVSTSMQHLIFDAIKSEDQKTFQDYEIKTEQDPEQLEQHVPQTPDRVAQLQPTQSPIQSPLKAALQSSPRSAPPSPFHPSVPQSALHSALQSPPRLTLQTSPSGLQSPPQSALQSALQSPPQSALHPTLLAAPRSALETALQSPPHSALQSALQSPPQSVSQSVQTCLMMKRTAAQLAARQAVQQAALQATSTTQLLPFQAIRPAKLSLSPQQTAESPSKIRPAGNTGKDASPVKPQVVVDTNVRLSLLSTSQTKANATTGSSPPKFKPQQLSPQIVMRPAPQAKSSAGGHVPCDNQQDPPFSPTWELPSSNDLATQHGQIINESLNRTEGLDVCHQTSEMIQESEHSSVGICLPLSDGQDPTSGQMLLEGEVSALRHDSMEEEKPTFLQTTLESHNSTLVHQTLDEQNAVYLQTSLERQDPVDIQSSLEGPCLVLVQSALEEQDLELPEPTIQELTPTLVQSSRESELNQSSVSGQNTTLDHPLDGQNSVFMHTSLEGQDPTLIHTHMQQGAGLLNPSLQAQEQSILQQSLQMQDPQFDRQVILEQALVNSSLENPNETLLLPVKEEQSPGSVHSSLDRQDSAHVHSSQEACTMLMHTSLGDQEGVLVYPSVERQEEVQIESAMEEIHQALSQTPLEEQESTFTHQTVDEQRVTLSHKKQEQENPTIESDALAGTCLIDQMSTSLESHENVVQMELPFQMQEQLSIEGQSQPVQLSVDDVNQEVDHTSQSLTHPPQLSFHQLARQVSLKMRETPALAPLQAPHRASHSSQQMATLLSLHETSDHSLSLSFSHSSSRPQQQVGQQTLQHVPALMPHQSPLPSSKPHEETEEDFPVEEEPWEKEPLSSRPASDSEEEFWRSTLTSAIPDEEVPQSAEEPTSNGAHSDVRSSPRSPAMPPPSNKRIAGKQKGVPTDYLGRNETVDKRKKLARLNVSEDEIGDELDLGGSVLKPVKRVTPPAKKNMNRTEIFPRDSKCTKEDNAQSGGVPRRVSKRPHKPVTKFDEPQKIIKLNKPQLKSVVNKKK